MTLKEAFIHNLYNIPGWRTNRHIVVVESDDWGSIRMPSKEVFNKLLKAGIRVDRCHYCTNDSIASNEDLQLLFDVLHSVKDKHGHPAVITANAVVANPDFKKIKESNFQQYYNKIITEGLSDIQGCYHTLNLWKQGHKGGYFKIQSHGREHLNVSRWMHYLQGDYPETKKAFEMGVYGISTTITSEKRKSFLPAFDFENEEEENLANIIVSDGLKIFEDIFGFKSKSFIAPNYTWSQSLERTITAKGVNYIQGQYIARYKCINRDDKKRLRKQGIMNKNGIIDLCRNALFEPSESPDKDWVNSCIAEIALAFRWHHPAIICSHRVNFVGSINIKNRDNGLRQLSSLLIQILKKWPDVEFMSSDQLGDLITNN